MEQYKERFMQLTRIAKYRKIGTELGAFAVSVAVLLIFGPFVGVAFGCAVIYVFYRRKKAQDARLAAFFKKAEEDMRKAMADFQKEAEANMEAHWAMEIAMKKKKADMEAAKQRDLDRGITDWAAEARRVMEAEAASRRIKRRA